MNRLRISLFALIFCAPYTYAQQIYTINYSYSGFFNYDRESGEAVFTESLVFKKADGRKDRKSYVRRVNLIDGAVIESIDLRAAGEACISYWPKLSPDKKLLASRDDKHKKINLFNMVTNECHRISYDFSITDFVWSEDGEWLLFKDLSTNSFYRLEPYQKGFEKYSSVDGRANFYTWNAQLMATMFAFKPKKLSGNEPNSYTSDDFYYYYIDPNGEWVQIEENHPLRNPQGDVYFKRRTDVEVPPWTEFFDAKTDKMLSSRSDFSLGGDRRYVVWLENNWVFFQGSSGLFNYRSGEFVSFGGESGNPVIPFSVDDGRYAIMYHQEEDLLKVYDLKKREYIESYLPFWRKMD